MLLNLLDGWVPVGLNWSDESPQVDWGHLGNRKFATPFFNETIDDAFKHPFSILFRHQTPFQVLSNLHQARPGIPPSGFIFHMSRCGSTLVSQMLASLPQVVMLSEPSPVDQTLRARFQRTDLDLETRADWLRWMVSALGQGRAGTERNLFIKFDCWNILDFDVIEHAYPDVPWIFLFRDPTSVLASQFRHRGKHMVPGVIQPELFGFAPGEITTLASEDYMARVLAAICKSALLRRGNPNGMFINYAQLPAIVWSSVLDFFKFTPDAGDLERLKTSAKFDAKNPFVPFYPSTAQARQSPSDSIAFAADKWLGDLYEELRSAATESQSLRG